MNSRVKAPELGLASASHWSIGKYDSPHPNLLTQKLPGAADSAGLRTYVGAPAPELGFLFPLGSWCPLSFSSGGQTQVRKKPLSGESGGTQKETNEQQLLRVRDAKTCRENKPP